MLRRRFASRRLSLYLLGDSSFNGGFSSRRWNSSESSLNSSDTTKTTKKPESSNENPSKLPNSRGVKLPPRDQRFVILSARASSILPRQKPKRITQQKVEFKSDQLDAQLKRLLVFKSEVPQEVVLESIQQLKPATPSVSEKRYDQLFNDILRAYTAPQLREFIRQYASDCFLGSKARKKEIVQYIVMNHWNVQKSKDISESSDVIVEHTLDFSRRDIFMIVSRNGKLPRYWTKSGAKIVILGEEQKIIVRSTADTYEWINASMMKALSNVITKEFDVTALQAIVDVENLPLDRIQRLSDVYIEREGNKLIASSFGQHRIDQAERLILGSSGFSPRQVESYLCDSSESNLKKGAYSTIIENDSLPWNYRERPWSRWRFVRRKIQKQKPSDDVEINIADIFDTPWKGSSLLNNVDEPQEPKFKLLNLNSSDSQEIRVAEQDSIAGQFSNAISNAVLTTYNSPNFDEINVSSISDQSSVTIAATFGYILHEGEVQATDNVETAFIAKSKTGLPASAFISNIPNISEFSRTLPLHVPFSETEDLTIDNEIKPDANIRLDKNAESDLESSKNFFAGGKSPAEAIEDLFDEPELGGSSKSGVISDEHSYYVQLKFLPSPFSQDSAISGNTTSFEKLPPLEMWLEVDENERADKSSANIVVVDREATTFASVPHMNSDIKFSAAQTHFLDSNQHSVHEFLAKSTLDFSGKVRINTPNILNVSLEEGQPPVPYMYQNMLYRKQVDLDYNGNILQLASIEGGLVGGHRTEATLVVDKSSNDFKPDDVDKLVSGALSFLNDIQSQNMRLRESN